MDTKSLIIGIILGAGISIISSELITSGEVGRYDVYTTLNMSGAESSYLFDTKTGNQYLWYNNKWSYRDINGVMFMNEDGEWVATKL